MGFDQPPALLSGFVSRKLKHDKTLRQRMGAMGRTRVEQHYCLQVSAPQLLQLLHEAKECSHVRH